PCLGLAGGGARLFMLAAMGRPKQVARILLVEDDESFSVLVRAYLRAMAADDKPPLATLPYYSSVPKLDAVGTLAAAREQLAARHYDLLLLDLHLPDSSGIDTLRAIRGEGERLIIVMTADEDPELPKKALERHQPFHDLELCRIVGGRQLWVSTSGEPVIDDQGRVRGYRGIGRDITSRKREEQLRALEQAVTRALAGAENPAEALRAVIR